MPAHDLFQRAAACIALASALVWTASPQAQAQSQPSPTAAAPAATAPLERPEPNVTVTLVDGNRLRGTASRYTPGQRLELEFDGVLLIYEAFEIRDVVFDAPLASGGTTPRPPPVAAPLLSEADRALRAQELTRLTSARAELLAKNRRWQVPVAGLALSVFSIGIAANQLMSGFALVGGDCPDDECSEDDEKADRQISVGFGLLLGGVALFCASVPMLAVRSARARRLGRVEEAITRLGGKLTLAPLLAPRAQAGLRVRLAF
jgi:hypothetical protein